MCQAEADVLTILDTCFASNTFRDVGASHRYELLAACHKSEPTRSAGPRSFTTALTWAVKNLLQGKDDFFSTQELLQKILEAPNLPCTQHPQRLVSHSHHRTPIVLGRSYVSAKQDLWSQLVERLEMLFDYIQRIYSNLILLCLDYLRQLYRQTNRPMYKGALPQHPGEAIRS